MAAFGAVLFDWRGTLFHDESDPDWIAASAAAIGRVLEDGEAVRLARQLGAAADDPRVIAAREQADCSAELHRAATLLELGLAGFDDELALAIWQRDGDPLATQPYPDVAGVLRVLKELRVRVGVISDIHYDIRRHFEYYGLLDSVDAFTLSFEHGCQKPDPRLFEIALDSLGATAAETLMVGDRASRDGGALRAGMTTLLLPSVPNYSPRGLDIVLGLV